MRNTSMSFYEFDAALSFAGENRLLAAAITRELQKLGRSVFYDRDHKAHLWGKRQDEYERIYGKASRFFVPLVSRHYRKKEWTQLEFSIARRASRRRKDEYILPIKIDETLMLGIPGDVNYLSSRDNTPKQIAAAIDEKCRVAMLNATTVIRSNRKGSIDQQSVLDLLSTSTRRALLLLATATLFHTKNALRDFFPDVNWDEALAALTKAGLVEEMDGLYSVVEPANDRLRSDKDEWLDFHREWIAVLEPLRSHLDVCACLSLHYLTVDRFDEAATLLADAAECGELGRWTDLYRTGLRAYAQPRFRRRFDSTIRLRVLNGIGLCLAHLKSFGEAVDAFVRLKRDAEAAGNTHWIGQALLNLGVASAQAGRLKQALRWYQKAQCHGQQHNDFILISRALGNQSQIVMTTNPIGARELIEQSIVIKRRGKDQVGLATATVQLGELASHQGDFARAANHYETAIPELTKLGMYHDCSIVSLHLGSAYLELGKQSKALTSLRRAKRIAADWEFVDILATAIGLETRALYEQGKLDEMRRACGELIELSEKHQLAESKICAQHGLGIAEILGGDVSGGRRTLSRTLDGAKELKDRKWIERCVVDRCRQAENGRLTEPAPALLRKAALDLGEQRRWVAAGDVWSRLGQEMHALVHCQVLIWG